MRYTAEQHDAFAQEFKRDGLVVLQEHFPRETLARWLHRPEVHIRVPRGVWDALTPTGRRLLRFNPVVPDGQALADGESYRLFAY
jgi:hypothetical protein